MLPDGLDQTAKALAMGAARTLPMVWVIPIFGGPALPAQMRLAIGVGMSALCLPIMAASPPAGGALLLALLLARDVFVGVAMGMVIGFMFRAAEAAGGLVDGMRGSSLSATTSPTSGEDTSPLGALMALFAAVVFLEIGGIGRLVAALARSYEAFPLAYPSGGNAATSIGSVVILASAKLIEATVGLAAPAMVALLLTDLVFGALGRAAPRLAGQALGASPKALLGLGAVLIGLASTDAALARGFRGFFELLQAMAHTGR